MLKLSDFPNVLQQLIRIVCVLLVGLLYIFGLLAIPVALLYAAIKPLFGPNPVAEYTTAAIAIGQGILFFAVVIGIIYVVIRLAARFAIVARVLRTSGYVFIALVAAGALMTCISKNPPHCVESRYITC